jgi:hypothetical protein
MTRAELDASDRGVTVVRRVCDRRRRRRLAELLADLLDTPATPDNHRA